LTTLHVLSAGSMLHAAQECAALASSEFPCTIDLATDHGHNIRDRLMRGTASADIVLIPADMAATLEAVGLLHGVIALGKVGIGGVVRTGSMQPAIGVLEELRAAISAADAILLTRAPTGDHLMRVIADFGLSNAIAPKRMRFDTSTALNAHLATRADNALGFGPETEIRAGNGVTWIGDVPPEIQIALPYAAAIVTHTKTLDAAEAFLKFLDSAAAREKIRRSGVR